mmetsp:Transcript_52080/g.134299  ORF Transcript_52080/g.134299 Transcript_52080/m.134299 type:complete len:285 (+) Transcript_52080:30-884(+)
MDAGITLPQPLAEEILWQYADVLRVGHLRLNGREIRWDTSASNLQQLQSFCKEFVGGFRQLEPLASWEDAVLCRAVHWFCKVVSINYVLSEVLDLLRQTLGAQCAIRTTGDRGASLVEYSAEVRPDCSMRICVSFKGKGNIICCDPATRKKQIRGTLSSLETEFPLPPGIGFSPEYHLQMTLKGSQTSQFVQWAARTCAATQTRPRQIVSLEAPLRTGDLETCGTPGGFSVLSTMSLGSVLSGMSAPLESDDDGALFSVPLTFTANSVQWGIGHASSAPGLIRL